MKQNIQISIFLLIVGCIVGSCKNNPPNNPPKTEAQQKQEKLQAEISELHKSAESAISELKSDSKLEDNEKEGIELFLDQASFVEKAILPDLKKEIKKLAEKIKEAEDNGWSTADYNLSVSDAKGKLQTKEKFLKYFETVVEIRKKEKKLLDSLPKKADNK